MTLSIGLEAALSGLATTSDQTSVVSRNVARAGEPGASRKIANLITLPGGGVKLASVTRVSNAALYDKLLGATSDAGARQAIVDALNRLDGTVNDPELDASPAALVGKLADAIQRYAAAPQDAAAARSAVAAAGDLAQALNDATRAIQQLRAAGRCRHRRLGRSRQHAARPVRDGQRRDRQGHAPGRRCHRLPRPARPDPGRHRRGSGRAYRHARRQRHGGLHRQRRHAVRRAPARRQLRSHAAIHADHRRQCRLCRWRARSRAAPGPCWRDRAV